MPGEVINLNGGDIRLNPKGVNEETIEAAEWLIKAALDGEIVGLAVAYVFADSGTGFRIAGTANTPATIGTLMKMATRMSQE